MAALTDIPVDRPMMDVLYLAFEECDHRSHYNELSAVRDGLWPLIAIACRHYRLPLHLFRSLGADHAEGE